MLLESNFRTTSRNPKKRTFKNVVQNGLFEFLPWSSTSSDLFPVLTLTLRLLLLLLLLLSLLSLVFMLLLTLTIVVSMTMIKVMNEVIEKHLCPKSLDSSKITSEKSILFRKRDLELLEQSLLAMLRLLELHCVALWVVLHLCPILLDA